MKRQGAYIGVFTALAMIVSYIEAMIPFSFGIPGIKLGLSNLVIVAVLYLLNGKMAFFVSFLRILLTGILFGSAYSFLYSLTGGMLSLGVMILLKKTGIFSTSGISMAGGVIHNLGQLLVAAFLFENLNLFYYLPVLLLSGLLTGFVIGIVSKEIQKRLPKEMFQ